VVAKAWFFHAENGDQTSTETLDPKQGLPFDEQRFAKESRGRAALTELGARGGSDAVSEGRPFAHDGTSLMRVMMWNLQCAFGEFDITYQPAGGGYDHFAPCAHVITVPGVDIPLADLADVVATKRLAIRVKDQLVLPRLDQALAERDKANDVAREGPGPQSTD
jgi:hypothetical protein